MATVQLILDGPRQVVIKVTGTATAENILDPTALSPPCTRVRLLKALYSLTAAGTALLEWDATAPTTLWDFNGGAGDKYHFCDTQGIPNDEAAGVTGGVLLTSAAECSMYLTFIKSDPSPFA